MPDAYKQQQDTFDQLFHDWGRAKIQAREIANHSLANLSYVNKMAVAKAQNLNPGERSQVTPFPAPTSINIESGNKELVEKLTEKLGELASGKQQQEPAPAPQQPTPEAPKTEPMPFWKKVVLAGTAGTALTLPPAFAWWLGSSGETPTQPASPVVQPVTDGKMGEVDMVIKRWQENPAGSNQNNPQ
jgi:hypothetical protein